MQISQEQTLPLTFSLKRKLSAYAAFFKLRLASLVVFSAVLGYLIAANPINRMDLSILILGGFLITGSSNGFNQLIEVNLDALMERTKSRPLVTGKMTLVEAIIVASVSGFTGIMLLWNFLNPLAGLLGVLALFLYVAVYTPLKQITSWAVLAGAFPGAIPPMLGWVASEGHFGLEPGLLFAVQFIWQFPHFWAIAWKADADYAKAGFRLLPSQGGKDLSSAFLILLYSLFLLLVSILPIFVGFAGNTALYLFIIAGLIMIIPSIQLFNKKTDQAATKVMFASFIYVPIVLLAWYIDKL